MRNRLWVRRVVVAMAVVLVAFGARAAWRATVASRGSEGAELPAAGGGLGGSTGFGWRLDVPGWVGALAGDDTLAVAVSANSMVTALDPATGSPLWAHEVGNLGPDAPAVSQAHVAVRAEDRVVLLDRSDGGLVWETPVEGPGPVAVVDLGGRPAVLIGTRAGVLAARAAADGTLLWEVTRPGVLRALPGAAGSGDVVAVWHSADRAVIAALDSGDGRVRWDREMGAAASGPGVDATSVYVGDGTGALMALNAADGTQRWSTDVGAGFGSDVAPVMVNGHIVAVDRLGFVHALAPADGSVEWQVDLGVPVLRGTPTVTRRSVVVTTVEGRAVMLAPSGEILGVSDAGAVVAGTATGGGHLLLGLRLTEPGRVEGLAL